ncbi:MAG: tripartite tricarboxylate transporter substrate binding protein [Burkholderiaceae bacterium]|nr:tripartite tricarboxylate transporter substrate binding protein [Burkholderiaceae bacterium]
MTLNRRQVIQGAGGALLGGAAASGAWAQSAGYPDRPIRLVVPWGSGSNGDIAMRLLAPRMSQILGQQVVVDNKAGATGVMGSEQVTRAAPDGYTLLMASIASHSTIVPLSPKLPYNVARDFSYIGGATSTPAVIVVTPSVPARDLKEFVAWTKTQPRGVDYASSGLGGSGHLATEMFRLKTGASLVHVPYKEAGRAVTDLAAGVCKMMIYYASVVPLVRSGQLRALAVMSDQRMSGLPDVATTEEQGFKGMTVSAWTGLMAPLGLPDPIRDKVFAALRTAVLDPALKPNLVAQGLEPFALPPAEFKRFVEGDITKWTEVVRVAGIKME